MIYNISTVIRAREKTVKNKRSTVIMSKNQQSNERKRATAKEVMDVLEYAVRMEVVARCQRTDEKILTIGLFNGQTFDISINER